MALVSAVIRVGPTFHSPPSLHDHVTWDFEQDVETEKDGETSSILRRVQLEVLGKAEQVGVTNIGPIEERQQVEERQPWDELEVAGVSRDPREPNQTTHIFLNKAFSLIAIDSSSSEGCDEYSTCSPVVNCCLSSNSRC